MGSHLVPRGSFCNLKPLKLGSQSYHLDRLWAMGQCLGFEVFWGVGA